MSEQTTHPTIEIHQAYFQFDKAGQYAVPQISGDFADPSVQAARNIHEVSLESIYDGENFIGSRLVGTADGRLYEIEACDSQLQLRKLAGAQPTDHAEKGELTVVRLPFEAATQGAMSNLLPSEMKQLDDKRERSIAREKEVTPFTPVGRMARIALEEMLDRPGFHDFGVFSVRRPVIVKDRVLYRKTLFSRMFGRLGAMLYLVSLDNKGNLQYGDGVDSYSFDPKAGLKGNGGGREYALDARGRNREIRMDSVKDRIKTTAVQQLRNRDDIKFWDWPGMHDALDQMLSGMSEAAEAVVVAGEYGAF